MAFSKYILRLIRKVGPSVYWIIMIIVALLKLANEVLFYPWRRTITNIATN
jgi:hypothetical protein